MYQLDPQISIQDIECPTLRAQVKTLVEELAQLCPSDSNVKASLKRIHDRFWMELNVCAESVRMQAIDSATGLTDVLDHIRSKMLNQIVDWRNHRFAS